MSLVTQFYILTNKLYEKTRGMDLSGDNISNLIGLKNDAVSAIRKFENEFKRVTNLKDEYVIQLYENDVLIGYVDHYKEDGDEIIAGLVKSPDEVVNDVYYSIEEAEEQVRILQEDADTFAGIEPDEPRLTYIIKERD